MIGRASMKNPWIYRQTAARLAGARPRADARRPARADPHHFQLLPEREDPDLALHKLRTFTGWYTHGLPEGRQLRLAINELPDVPSYLAAIEQFFDGLPLEQAASGRPRTCRSQQREHAVGLALDSERALAAVAQDGGGLGGRLPSPGRRRRPRPRA